jgi:hypothetical protein
MNHLRVAFYGRRRLLSVRRRTTRTARERTSKLTLIRLRKEGAQAPESSWSVLAAAIRRGHIADPADYLERVTAWQKTAKVHVTRLPDGPGIEGQSQPIGAGPPRYGKRRTSAKVE